MKWISVIKSVMSSTYVIVKKLNVRHLHYSNKHKKTRHTIENMLKAKDKILVAQEKNHWSHSKKPKYD